VIALNILNLFKNRRSIRAYSSKEVTRDALFRILEASTWAPSAHNAQPWRFIVISGSALKQKLAEAMASAWYVDMSHNRVPEEKMSTLLSSSVERFTNAPIIIIVCLTRENLDSYPDKRRQEIEHTMALQSVAAAIENMLLAAHAEGLGACWFCAPLFCQNTVRKILEIPDFVEPQALITLGYSTERPAPPIRKAIEEIAYMNCWGCLYE
jgi:coenzyme F420-0:L-glutamate ligase/coenzyme F420-1:gamma-L-glutamate ligase